MADNRLLRQDIPSSLGDALYQTGRNALLYPFRNPEAMAEFGLGMAPGSGEAMSARDAWNASGEAGNALMGGNYRDAAAQYGNMATGILGALPGAGIIARGTKRGAAWMDRNLPAGVNKLLDAATPSNMQDVAPAFPAWHGSPHDYPAERLVKKPDGTLDYLVGKPDVLPDVPMGYEIVQDLPLGRVRLDKVGTGEGAQAYGHGWYAAENPATGKRYAEQLARTTVDGQPLGNDLGSLIGQAGGLDGAIAQAREGLKSFDSPFAREQLANLEALKGRDVRVSSKLYHTEIDAEPHQLLDWDKPFSEQGEVGTKAMAVLEKLGYSASPNRTMADIKQLAKERYGGMSPEQTSQALREAGIPGIQYLDQGSRGAGEGSRNFVLFDDQLVKILSKE